MKKICGLLVLVSFQAVYTAAVPSILSRNIRERWEAYRYAQKDFNLWSQTPGLNNPEARRYYPKRLRDAAQAARLTRKEKIGLFTYYLLAGCCVVDVFSDRSLLKVAVALGFGGVVYHTSMKSMEDEITRDLERAQQTSGWPNSLSNG